MIEKKRARIEVNLTAIRKNLQYISAKAQSPDVGICAVLKADAYGHGAVRLARMLEQEKQVTAFAVATVDEAVALRKEARVKKDIIILGSSFSESNEDLFHYDIRPSVYEEDVLNALEEAAVRLHTTGILNVHVPVDTGMGRIGVTPDDAGLAFIQKILESHHLRLEGLYTHFATADEEDPSFTKLQLDRFLAFEKRIREEVRYTVPVLHCDNSAALINGCGMPGNMVRAGIALYGHYPSEAIKAVDKEKGNETLVPALSFCSHVSFVKKVPQGTEISYGRTFVTSRPSVIATIPIGYADGYAKNLSGKSDVLIRGKRVPVAGRICMDKFMVDVTDLPEVQKGDKVTLIGHDGDEYISLEELAELSGRYHYEFLCCLNKRVPRIYVD